MGLLRFIMITIFILWLIRIILRLVFPLVLKNIFGKMQQQANGGAAPQQKKPEGSISIEYMPPQPKKGNPDKLGDFVDFEEVK
jgi:K+-transporting ATPase c subunit